MGWLSKTINSSIGRKTVLAATGLLLTLFLIGHLVGNASAFRGRAAFEVYAAHFHGLGPMLYLAESVLFLVFFLHIGFGLYLFLDNLRAEPTGYAVSRSAGGRTWGSRTMPNTGLFLLLFLTQHLASFRFTNSESVSHLLRDSLTSAPISAFYLIALGALTLHLGHGLWSLCLSLGLSHPKYDAFLENAAFGLSIFIGTLFGLIPLLALFWPDFLR